MNVGYIYLITNLINNKKYVGQTTNSISERWRQHCSRAKNENAMGIDGAIKKYGAEHFSYELIKECPINELDKWEIYYIKEYQTYQGDNSNLGYNLTLGGAGGILYDIDEAELLKKYLSGQTAKELGQYYGCSDKTIKNRLSKYNIDFKQHDKQWKKEHYHLWGANLEKGRLADRTNNIEAKKKKVRIIELNLTFNSLADCSRWLMQNGYSKAASMEATRKSLSRHLNGERESYLKMHFEYVV